MAEHMDKLQPLLLVIDSALGSSEMPARPELWEMLASPDSKDSARLTLDAATVRIRECKQMLAAAEAAKAEGKRVVERASERAAEYARLIAEMEENLVRPLCKGFGEGDTRQFDTGFARVALRKKKPRVELSELGRKVGEDNVVAALPPDLVHLPPPKPDKNAIREALEAGVVVPGFELTAGETRVEWRS